MIEKIIVKNLTKSFNNEVVLENISFSAKKGDVIAILGTSGSGKSTLLKCLNLLSIPDEGLVQIDHCQIQFNPSKKCPLTTKEITTLRTKVGMVFQQFNLWSHLTILQNLIEAPIHVLKQDRIKTIAEAEQLLAKVGLSEKHHHYPNQLSGGQQQRAAIARALMMKPEIMLFDEPTSALDPEMVSEVLNVMQQLASEGMTMLIATHELNFAKRIANQSLFLDQGKLIEQGNTEQMFAQPATIRFMQFLDAMSHIRG